MSDRGIPQPAYLRPSADEVLQVGLISMLVFAVLSFLTAVVTTLAATAELGRSLATGAWMSLISLVPAFAILLLVGFPSSLAAARFFLWGKRCGAHVLTYGTISVLISPLAFLPAQLVAWGALHSQTSELTSAYLVADGVATTVVAASAMIAWCIRWLRITPSGRIVARERVVEVSTRSTSENA